MIPFKAANPKNSLFRGVISIAIGISIFLFPGFAQKYIIQIIGGILILNGLINMLIRTFKKSTTQSAFMVVPKGITSFVSGLILLVFPAFVMEAFMVVVGIILIIAGGSQLMSQIWGRSLIGFSLIFSIIGLIAFLSGIVMLSKPFESAKTLMVFFGAIVSIYGIGEILWSYKIRKYLKKQPKQEPQTIDAVFEEID